MSFLVKEKMPDTAPIKVVAESQGRNQQYGEYYSTHMRYACPSLLVRATICVVDLQISELNKRSLVIRGAPVLHACWAMLDMGMCTLARAIEAPAARDAPYAGVH